MNDARRPTDEWKPDDPITAVRLEAMRSLAEQAQLTALGKNVRIYRGAQGGTAIAVDESPQFRPPETVSLVVGDYSGSGDRYFAYPIGDETFGGVPSIACWDDTDLPDLVTFGEEGSIARDILCGVPTGISIAQSDYPAMFRGLPIIARKLYNAIELEDGQTLYAADPPGFVHERISGDGAWLQKAFVKNPRENQWVNYIELGPCGSGG